MTKIVVHSVVVFCLGLAPVIASAQSGGSPSRIDALRQQGHSVRSITPIFSQLLLFSFPAGFRTVFENGTADRYIQESVLEGETVKKWSQMITVTGARALAQHPNATPQLFAGRIAGGFKTSCPDSFSARPLGTAKINGIYETFGAIVACGIASPTGTPYSEAMLLVVIRGESDYYTIQWAERGQGSTTPLVLDDPKWVERLKMISPIKLCPILAGEQPPYPSCVERK